jgi:two-component sensor histidine kinase/ABC-type amino acid transport substrate-binding protein
MGMAMAAEPIIPTVHPLRVVVDFNYPPYAFLDSEGKLVGIVPDQWKLWSKITGVKIDIQGMPWSEAQAAILSGKADVIDTIFDTPARELDYIFTPPYATIRVPVYIHKSISGISGLKDLVGFRVGVKTGDASVDTLNRAGITDLKKYPNYTDVIQAAAGQEVRIFCVDDPPADYLLYKLGLDKEFHIAFILDQGQFHRAVLKSKPELLRLIDKGFSRISTGEYEAINRKWMGAEIFRQVDLRIVGIAVAIMSFVLFVLFLGVFVLSRQVQKATRELQQVAWNLQIEKSQFLRAEQLSKLGNWSLDLTTMVIRGSEGAQKIYGVADRELTLQEVQSCRLPEYKESGDQMLRDLIAGVTPYLLETKIQRISDGSIRAIRSAAEYDPEKKLVFGVIQDVTEQRAIEDALRKSLEEKETLLREVHHRVKNNLQVITSILNLEQAELPAETANIFEDTQARIRSMALVHEYLYRSTSLSQIGLQEYIRDVADAAMDIYFKKGVMLTADIEALEVSIDVATPLGLFTMEAITNAIRHGINGHPSGSVHITLNMLTNDQAQLTIHDTGDGFDTEHDVEGLGSKLMEALASQLHGVLRKYNDNGAVVDLVFRAIQLPAAN